MSFSVEEDIERNSAWRMKNNISGLWEIWSRELLRQSIWFDIFQTGSIGCDETESGKDKSSTGLTWDYSFYILYVGQVLWCCSSLVVIAAVLWSLGCRFKPRLCQKGHQWFAKSFIQVHLPWWPPKKGVTKRNFYVNQVLVISSYDERNLRSF